MPLWKKVDTMLRAWEVLEAQGWSVLYQKSKRLYLSGDYDRPIKEALLKHSNSHPVFLDIGAHVGLITLDVYHAFKRCLCFEPESRNYSELVNNTRDKPSISTFNFALGETTGKRSFFVSQRNPGGHRLAITADEKGEPFDRSEVEVVRLDDVIHNENCAIKIDVEGAEFDVMKGARRLLSENHNIIVSEFAPWIMNVYGHDPMDYIDYMQSLEYSVYDLYWKPLTRDMIERFVRAAKGHKRVIEDIVFLKE